MSVLAEVQVHVEPSGMTAERVTIGQQVGGTTKGCKRTALPNMRLSPDTAVLTISQNTMFSPESER